MSVRLKRYLNLAIITAVTTFLVVLWAIAADRDVDGGIQMGMIPGFVISQFVFGVLFVKHDAVMRIMIAVLMATIIAVLLTGVARLDVLHQGEQWLLAITCFMVSVVSWEIYFRVDGK